MPATLKKYRRGFIWFGTRQKFDTSSTWRLFPVGVYLLWFVSRWRSYQICFVVSVEHTKIHADLVPTLVSFHNGKYVDSKLTRLVDVDN